MIRVCLGHGGVFDFEMNRPVFRWNVDPKNGSIRASPYSAS